MGPHPEGQQYHERVACSDSEKLAPFSDVPVIFTSVPDRQRILEVLQTALRVYRSRARRIPTSEFNDYILPIIEETPPPSIKGKYIRIKYAAQLPNPTPVFAFSSICRSI